MRLFIPLLLVCCLLAQCAKPLAEFVSAEVPTARYKVPARIQLNNTSKNADSYSWRINGEEVSTSQDLDYLVTASGRHQIELIAKQGTKLSTKRYEIILDPATECTVLMETSMGDMVFILNEETIGHLHNFTGLVESGYYKGLLFHRVINGFMIQGGDNKTRSGGQRFEEPPAIPHEIDKGMPHFRGTLAAARMPDEMNPDKESSGSQFYIVDGRPYTKEKILEVQANKIADYSDEDLEKYIDQGGSPQLDGEYTVFGYMVEGYEVLDKIAAVQTDKYDKPLEAITIIDVKFLN